MARDEELMRGTLGQRIIDALRRLDETIDAVHESKGEVRLFLMPRGIHLTTVGARVYFRDPDWNHEHVEWVNMAIPDDEDD